MYGLHNSSRGRFRQKNSCPVSGHIVVGEKCLEEMVSVVFLSELDAEVIHDEDEDYWAPGVWPEAGCDCTLVVSVFTQSGGEEVVGQFFGLFEAVDALFVYLEVNPVTVAQIS